MKAARCPWRSRSRDEQARAPLWRVRLRDLDRSFEKRAARRPKDRDPGTTRACISPRSVRACFSCLKRKWWRLRGALKIATATTSS